MVDLQQLAAQVRLLTALVILALAAGAVGFAAALSLVSWVARRVEESRG